MPCLKSDKVEFQMVPGISGISAEEWNACVGVDHPFLAHSFFYALEAGGCVGDNTGWLPRYLAGRDSSGRLVGIAPLFAKTHSYGEYVFDWAWAEAYDNAGGRYYPKWLCAVPFTPVPGSRLLGSCRLELAQAMQQLCIESGFSSIHVTFLPEEEARILSKQDYSIRTGMQFHWFNRGYETFDDFLGVLNARKRKMIKKEREHLRASGIEVVALSGNDIQERHWDHFFQCYHETASRKWGQPYLTRKFFSLLGEGLGERIVLMIARRAGRDIAAALNLKDGRALYGRYWGTLEDHSFLHFETSYYAAIEYAIEHGLARVEAGAQGEHKIQRGYEPVKTFSAHYIPDKGFRQAIDNFLLRERHALSAESKKLQKLLPYGNH